MHYFALFYSCCLISSFVSFLLHYLTSFSIALSISKDKLTSLTLSYMVSLSCMLTPSMEKQVLTYSNPSLKCPPSTEVTTVYLKAELGPVFQGNVFADDVQISSICSQL